MRTLVSALLLGACLDTPTDPRRLDEAGLDDLEIPDGTTGVVRMPTTHGPEDLHYIVRSGHAIYQDDIDLGPVSKLHLRGGAADLGERWPSNKMFFRFDSGFTGLVCSSGMTSCADVRDRVRDTLEAMETQLPIDFIEDTNHTAGDYVLYQFGDWGQVSAGVSDSIGMDGGEQTISFRPGHLEDTPTLFPEWNLQPSTGTIRHETLHALGLWHEQSRNDRDNFIDIHWSCIDVNGNYEKQDGSADLGPYDFNSIMHYGDTSGCVKSIAPPFDDPDGDGCICKTMSPKIGASFGGQPRPGGFSIEDANTLYRMYANGLANPETGDNYGTAIAIGDFDGDGYEDMAVGIPDENRDLDGVSHPNAGSVMVYRGTSAGQVAWKLISEKSFSGEYSDHARFGAALVALDFDADGLADLAVGAPDEDNSSGAVYVFLGSQTEGLVADRKLTQSIIGYSDGSDDRFGAALAAGPITGRIRTDGCTVFADNVVYDALVIGAPGDKVNNVRTGAAYIVHAFASSTCGDLLAASTRLVPNGTTAAGDGFGSAIAVGELDNDGKHDLAIGAPHHDNNAGRVYTFGGVLPSGSPLLWGAMAVTGSRISGAAGSKLGTAIAIGNIVSGGGNELAMGAPGGSGHVKVMNGGGLTLTNTLPLVVQASPETGDEFGAALAIGNVDRTDDMADLVVGAPGENSDAGAITIFRNNLATRTSLLQSETAPISFDEPGDRFGAALAIGQLDGFGRRDTTFSPGFLRSDLAIGAPGERSGLIPGFDDGPFDAGGVSLMRGRSSLIVEPWHAMDQLWTGKL